MANKSYNILTARKCNTGTLVISFFLATVGWLGKQRERQKCYAGLYLWLRQENHKFEVSLDAASRRKRTGWLRIELRIHSQIPKRKVAFNINNKKEDI